MNVRHCASYVEPNNTAMPKLPLTGSTSVKTAGFPLRVSPPWTWSALIIVGAATMAALAASWTMRVEVTGRARGILRPLSGVRALVARTDGTVSDVLLRPGDRVAAGTAVVRLRSADVEASLLESTRDLAVREEDRRRIDAENGYARQRTALLERLRIADAQIASYEQSVGRQKAHVDAAEQLHGTGLMSSIQVDDAHEQYAAALRAVQNGRDAEKRTRQELAAIDAAHDRELRKADALLGEARARRDSVDLPAQKGTIENPAAGTTDAPGGPPRRGA